MLKKVSRWFAGLISFLGAFAGMAIPAFAMNPIMGDETQGTVKLMTVLLVVSAILIVVLVAMSVIKKKKGK